MAIYFAINIVLSVNDSDTHNDEMCNLYVMFFAENGRKPYFTCRDNSFPHLFDDIPPGNDVPLPPDEYLDAVASGQVHNGIDNWQLLYLYVTVTSSTSLESRYYRVLISDPLRLGG